ncbi:MAG: hypothetical protein Q7J16_04200 [Candidatus Cloacimonadales bacterium]|nr:hypothetical protein [Candidatus Cloacimonadales bacterium]
MKAMIIFLMLFSILFFGCSSPTEEENKEIINVTNPDAETVWVEYQANTSCNWNNAKGATVYIEIYKGEAYLGIYQEETDNDGSCIRTAALGNWGTGYDYRLKVIDEKDNFGWSEYFAIETSAQSTIIITYPDASTAWQEFQVNTYCDWTDATGDSIYAEIYQGTTYKGIWHDWTDNDGHTSRNGALDDWGAGTDFRLKVIDSDDNFGWSSYFTIEVLTGQIEILYPESSTIWMEFQTDTYCDWTNAAGDSIYAEIYQGTTYKGIWHDWTDNDGHTSRNGALDDWGSGTDFRLKVIDAYSNSGWSDYFTIEALSTQIDVIYPESTTTWIEFQTNTYCDWANASGDSVNIEIYEGTTYKGLWHDWTDNDNHTSRNGALDDWGAGTDFHLKIIDAVGNEGWSEYFTIEAVSPGQIYVTYPDAATVWTEFQINTECDWNVTAADSVIVDIYKGDTYLGIYNDWTDNDGHCNRDNALGDWGTGTDFRLKITDSNNMEDFSEYFTIEALTDPISVTYPDASTVWQEFQIDTFCDWINATGDSVYVEIYQNDTYKGLWHDWTANDGHTSRNGALDDWGTGTDFRLKVIDANSNEGWSEYFAIE